MRQIVGPMLLVAVLCPRPLSAMEVAMFDDLAAEDQADFIAYLVDVTRDLLDEDGRRDAAGQVAELFRGARGRRSAGEAEFREGLNLLRAHAAAAAARGISGITITAGGNLRPVESVFVSVLRKNNISLARPLMRRLADTIRARPFWPRHPLSSRVL